MSLLKRLSEQAQQVKDSAAEQQRGQQERKDRYTAVTLPTVKAIARYLSELAEHLKTLRPSVSQEFDLPGYGRFQASPVFDYAVKTDIGYTDILMQCTWKSRIDSERAPRLSLNSFERIRTMSETFRRLHIGGIKEERKGPTGLTIQASVQANGYIHSKLHVRGAVNDEQLIFTFENVDRLDSTRRTIPVGLISSEVLDRLGEFILRENDLIVREAWLRELKAPESLKWLEAFAEVERPSLTRAAEQAAVARVEVSTGFVAATRQKEDRDNQLLADLQHAAALAEAAVLQGMANPDMRDLGSERELPSLDFGQVELQPNTPTQNLPAQPRAPVQTISPNVAQPVVAQPVVAQPVVAQPVVAQPVVAQPVVAQPVVAQPVVAQPVVAQPVVAQPVVAQPVVAQPVVAQPVVAQPVVAQPVARTPLAQQQASAAPTPAPTNVPLPRPAAPAVPANPFAGVERAPSQGTPATAGSDARDQAARKFLDRFRKLRDDIDE